MCYIKKISVALNKNTGRLIYPIIDSGNIKFDLGFYSRKIEFDICGDIDGEKDVKLGFIKGCFYNIEKIVTDDLFPYKMLKQMDEETNNILMALYAPWRENFGEDYIGSGKNIFYVKLLYIEKEYRDSGVGTKALKNLQQAMNFIFDYNVGCIMLKPIPFEMMGDQDVSLQIDELLCARVNKFYKRIGFLPIEDTEYIYKNTDKN